MHRDITEFSRPLSEAALSDLAFRAAALHAMPRRKRKHSMVTCVERSGAHHRSHSGPAPTKCIGREGVECVEGATKPSKSSPIEDSTVADTTLEKDPEKDDIRSCSRTISLANGMKSCECQKRAPVATSQCHCARHRRHQREDLPG